MGKTVLLNMSRGRALMKMTLITVLVLLIVSAAESATTIWDESSNPLPFTWNHTNFDDFNVSGTGTEELTVLQGDLRTGQRTIDKNNLTYTTTAQPVPLKVATALNLVGNNEGLANIGLEQASWGKAFENGQYYILNWQAEKYVALNGKVDKLAKMAIEQGISEKKTLTIGETWNIGGGLALKVNSIDARATPRQVWLTLSKDGVKKDDKVITSGTIDAKPIYTYIERSLGGESDVPVFVTYVDSIFAGANSNIVQLRYTWAINESVIQIRSVDTYGIFNDASMEGKKLLLHNGNLSITLSADDSINLTGNIKFKVDKNTTSLKFYPVLEPRLNITASPASIESGTSRNVIFTVTSKNSAVNGATVTLSGAANGSGVTDVNGLLTMNINASYIGRITAEAEKTGYTKGTTILEAAYSIPLAAMASWNISENYVLNLIDIDAMVYPRQARFQLLKDNKVVDDAVLFAGQRYYYNSSGFTIFTAEVDTIFNGTQGRLVRFVNASQNSESGGSLTINASHLFKSGNFTGIDWQLNESYNLRMMDIDVHSYSRQVYFELLKSDEIKDDVVLSSGQTYIYNNPTNLRVLEGTVDVIFSGIQGNLVKLVNVTQNSDSTGTPLFNNGVHLYKSTNFSGVGTKLNESYELRMMDIDAKGSPRQVWFELLKDNVTIDDSILSHGTPFSKDTYLYNIPGKTILTAKVDGIFKGETASIVTLKEVNHYSETTDAVFLNNSTLSFTSGNISRADRDLYENYTISLLGTDVGASPRMAWLRLYKNNNTVYDKITWQGDIYRYFNSSNGLVLYAEVDGIFAGATSNLVVLKNVTQYSELNSSILINGTKYVLGNISPIPPPTPPSPPTPTPSNITYEIRGTVWNDTSITTATNSWDPANFPGFFYDIKDDLGTENLTINQINLAGNINSNNMLENRIIQKGNLKYSTVAQARGLKVASALNLLWNNTGLNEKGLEQAETGKAFDNGLYYIVGWQGEKYVALNGKVDKLSKLVVEQGNSDNKVLAVGETWDIGDGWTLTANAIDASATPKQVWLILSKNGIKKDDKVVNSSKPIYTYFENISSEIDVPLFITYVDSIYSGDTTDMVRLRYTWAISTSVTNVTSGNTYGIFKDAEVAGKTLFLRNSDTSIILTRDSTINLISNISFRVADSEVLRFYPVTNRTVPGTYEIRGTIWNESFSPAIYWNPRNFAGFFYDLKEDLGAENLSIIQPDIDGSHRTIAKGNLTYSTTAQLRKLNVADALIGGPFGDINAILTDVGLEQAASGKAFDNGTYYIAGWRGEKHVALNGKVNKLSKLIFEQGFATPDKKTLTVGETWNIGDGWTLTANSIDAKASPRQVWFTLSKDGIKKDDKVVTSGTAYATPIYTYVEKSLAGETDVPVFVTYVDSIFAGATTDMVQLRYTWLISEYVTEIKSSDTYGVFRNAAVNGKTLSLRNSDTDVQLTRDNTINLLDNISFRVADSDILRFYPFVVAKILPSSPGSRTITVDDSGGADYTKIQDAINNAGNGDTILVYSGTYFENVNMNKLLILKGIDNGAGRPVVDARRSGSAITLSAGSSKLEGFMAINTSHPYADIYVNSSNNIIRNNIVSNGSPGIFLFNSNNNILNGNNASNNWGESGIVLSYSNNNTLTNNIVSNNNYGIDLVYSNRSTLSSNIISKNQYGIYLIYAYNNFVFNNYFNNTNNLFFNVQDYHYPAITYSNIWNISKTLDSNIIGGPYLGGNYWAYPNGTGFSQTCPDDDNDGICDSQYIPNSNNIDYMPLAGGIRITSPKSGATITVLDNLVTISFSAASPPINVSLYLNGYLINNFSTNNPTGTFTTEVDYHPGTINQLKASAIDRFGNINFSIVNVNVINNTYTSSAVLDENKTMEINLENQTSIDITTGNGTIDGTITITSDANITRLNGSISQANRSFGLKADDIALDRYVEIDTTVNKLNLSSVNLTMFYTDAELDVNRDGDATDEGIDIDENRLTIYWWNGTVWEPLNKGSDYSSKGGPKVLDVRRNLTADKLTVQLDHFSTFSLVGEQIPTTTYTPSGSGGSDGSSSGGGGGGGTSGENFSNIEIREKHDLHIFKDKVTSYAFTSKGNPILFINITGNISAGEINTAVEVLRNTSTLVKIQAPGIVYKNTNVWVGTSGFAGPKNIKGAVIRFKVENSWLDNNKLAASDVRMMKWDGKEWIQLETAFMEKDSMNNYFEAKTDKFSHFAITGIKGLEILAVTPTITVQANPTSTATSSPKKGIPGFDGIMVIIALSAIYVFRKR